MLGNFQYFRRECLEVVGIPDSVKNIELEENVLTIFYKNGCEAFPHDILIARHVTASKRIMAGH